jgi:hypothetical protein
VLEVLEDYATFRYLAQGGVTPMSVARWSGNRSTRRPAETDTGLDADVDGSGAVNGTDRILAMRSRGGSLAQGLKLDG